MKKLYRKMLVMLLVTLIVMSMDNVCILAETVSENSNEIENEEQRDIKKPNTVSDMLIVNENSELTLPLERNILDLGSLNSAVIAKNGSLYTWGENEHGELGNGTNTPSIIPIKIMDNVASVNIGDNHSAAITEDGSLYTWGFNEKYGGGGGQLGNGTNISSNVPIKIMDNVVSVSLGEWHSAAITEDGSLYTWGCNFKGQLGDGTYNDSNVPIKIMDNVISVSLGYWHSAAITKDGSLYIWGDTYGFIEDGTYISNIPIKIMDNVVSVSFGLSHIATITKDGSLYVWGSNYDGQLGNGTFANSNVPIKVMDNVALISLGYQHSAAVTKDGSLYMWGRSGAQLGNGTSDSCSKVNIPTKIMNNVVAVSTATIHSAAITKDNSLYTWGFSGGGYILGKDVIRTSNISPMKIMDISDGTLEGPSTWQSKSGVEGFVYRLYNITLSREPEDKGLVEWIYSLDTKKQSAAEVAWGFFFSDEFKNKNYTDEQYVELLYKTMFGRASDASGKADWLKCLENGVSREYVYRGFAESEEFSNLCSSYGVNRGTVTLGQYRDRNMQATGFIARLYTKMLGRKFDEDGLEYWCRAYLTKEKTIENIASDGFLHSEELKNLNLSNKDFVTRMYETFLNREPEEAGLNDWVGRMERGEETRDSLVYGFTNSREFANLKAEYNLP